MIKTTEKLSEKSQTEKGDKLYLNYQITATARKRKRTFIFSKNQTGKERKQGKTQLNSWGIIPFLEIFIFVSFSYVQEIEFLHLLGVFLVWSAAVGSWDPISWVSIFVILVSLLSFFQPLVHADVCFCFDVLSNCLCKFSMSFWSSRYLAFMLSSSNFSVLISFLAAVHPSWNDCGVPSSNVFRFDIIGWYWDSPASFRVLLAIALFIFTCSEKRTCTTILSGSRSFCAACMQASIESFWQSITRQSRFLSCSESVGWAWKYDCAIKLSTKTELFLKFLYLNVIRKNFNIILMFEVRNLGNLPRTASSDLQSKGKDCNYCYYYYYFESHFLECWCEFTPHHVF